LYGLGIGNDIVRNGSNVMDILLQSKHYTVDLSYPYIRSTIIDLFLAINAFQCSALTISSGLPSESYISI